MDNEKKQYTPERITTKLREFEMHHTCGMSSVEAILEIGISAHAPWTEGPTFYRWRKQYGQMDKAKFKHSR